MTPCSSALPGWARPLSAQPPPRVLELAASKVADSTAFAHLGRGKFVFARVGGIEYGPNWTPGQPIVFSDGEHVEVDRLSEGRVEFLALSHPLFLARTKASIYPDGRQPEHFLAFKSLWNRSVAELLVRYRAAGEVHAYHALDFHGGLAPLYVEASGLYPCVIEAVAIRNRGCNLRAALRRGERAVPMCNRGCNHTQ